MAHDLAGFIRALWSEGRVRVGPPFGGDSPDEEERSELEAALRELDADARLEFPGDAPELSVPAAAWAAGLVCRASGCLAHRDVEPQELARLLGEPCPAKESPSVVYSVDLAFRFLPDLVRLARAASPSDPLVALLTRWCREWPLSSVGVSGVGEVDPSWIAAHAGLLRLYVDRIIERKDASRAGPLAVRTAIDEALGAHPELSPELAAAAPQTGYSISTP